MKVDSIIYNSRKLEIPQCQMTGGRTNWPNPLKEYYDKPTNDKYKPCQDVGNTYKRMSSENMRNPNCTGLSISFLEAYT